MMTKPALTAKDWADALAWDGFLPLKPDECIELYGRPHAMAAQALYGQPFGLTRDDVVVLRENAGDVESAYATKAMLALADRIEALLPPE